MRRILGLDPGLRHTGWGVIEKDGNHLKHIANGVISPSVDAPLPERLAQLQQQLELIIQKFMPHRAAIEEVFVNKNAASTLKLGMARGAVMACVAGQGVQCAEYAANLVKKTVTGSGHADKGQMTAMVKMLLPGANPAGADAADALAVAICHAHHNERLTVI